MKFVCDQCKAKYQISDEKVVGKTVKMKCRKCGHMIEVRAAVTETSVATSAPKEASHAAAPPPERAPEKAAGKAASPPAKPAATPSPGAAVPGAPPPRPGAAGAPPPRPVTAAKASPLATSLAAQRPAPQRATGPTPQAPSALAGAFNRSVQKDDEPTIGGFELREISSADEWYAAINGVPVGPVRIAELRRKAALGAITEESLVWQEGLEEWRPVKAFPELAEMVREAAAVGRPSLLPPAAWEGGAAGPTDKQSTTGRPASVRPGAPARAPAAASAAPAARTPLAGAVAAKSNVIPISSRLATAEKLDEISVAVMPPEAPAPMVAADPFAMPAPAAAAPSSLAAPAQTSSIAPPPPEKKSPPWIPIAMLVLATAFGVTLAIVVALPKPVAPAPAPAQSVLIIHDLAPAVAAAPTETASAAAAPTTAPKIGSGSSAPKAAASASSKPIDVAGLLGPNNGPLLSGLGGGGAGPGGGGGGPLTQSQIETVVASRKVGVRRACLERTESTSTGNVTVRAKVTVGGNGLVQGVSASGNDPIIAACIEKNVKTWTFPASGGTTTFDIPFSFVRQ